MKTMHKSVSVALLSSLTLITGLAFAADPDQPTNPERSFTFQAPPTSKTRAEVRAELDEYRLTRVAPDGWQDVGGEKGYAMVPHKFAFVDGKLVNTTKVDQSAIPSQVWTEYDMKMASLNYKNSQ